MVSAATCGRAAGALDVLQAIKDELGKEQEGVRIIEVGCLGHCYAEPMVIIAKPGFPKVAYGYVTPGKALRLVKYYIRGGDISREFALGALEENELIPSIYDLPCFKYEKYVLLEKIGHIDPEDIDHYIAGGGYEALAKSLQMEPEDVSEEIKVSGLRGRSGAGFSTAHKWGVCRSSSAKTKYLVCVRMELKGFDSSGRRTPSPLAGPDYTYPLTVDTVIEAIGQRPDTSFIRDGVKVAKGGTITADPRTLATDKPGVFAGGDAVTGPKTVIWAVAAGQRAATSIKRYLQGKPLSIFVERDGYEPIAVPQVAPTEEEVKERARIQASEIESKERKSSYKEIVLAFRPNEAREEASRCLRCDLEVGEEE